MATVTAVQTSPAPPVVVAEPVDGFMLVSTTYGVLWGTTTGSDFHPGTRHVVDDKDAALLPETSGFPFVVEPLRLLHRVDLPPYRLLSVRVPVGATIVSDGLTACADVVDVVADLTDAQDALLTGTLRVAYADGAMFVATYRHGLLHGDDRPALLAATSTGIVLMVWCWKGRVNSSTSAVAAVSAFSLDDGWITISEYDNGVHRSTSVEPLADATRRTLQALLDGGAGGVDALEQAYDALPTATPSPSGDASNSAATPEPSDASTRTDAEPGQTDDEASAASSEPRSA
jgi:hypothetical protein